MMPNNVITLVPDNAELWDIAHQAAAQGLHLIDNGARWALSPTVPPGWTVVPLDRHHPPHPERSMNTRERIPEEGQLLRADLDMLFPSPTNPRKSFPETELQELAESIKQLGVMQPILVRPLPAETKARAAPLADRAALEIVAGERRWRASRLAGMTDVPILLRHLDDRTVICMQVVENLQREGLNAIDEAQGFEQLQEQGMNAQAIADQVGKSKAYIYAKLKLLALCEEGRALVRAGKLSESVALLVARIPVPDLQRKAIERVVTPDWEGEQMSYRSAARLIRDDYTHRLSRAPFDIHDERLHPIATSCEQCRDRLGNQPDTTPDLADVCTDNVCYQQKLSAHKTAVLTSARADGRTIIAGQAAKQVKPFASASCHNGYVGLSEKCYELEGYPTYRELLDKVPGAVEVAVLDYPGAEAAEEIVVRADLSKALRAQGISLTHRAGHDDTERKKAEEALEAENRYRRRLFDEIRQQPALMLTTPDLVMLAEMLLHRLWEEHRYAVAQIWYPECKRKESVERLEERLSNMDDTELTLLLRDILLATELKANPYMNDSAPTRMLTLAERIGIDPERIRREQQTADKAKTTVYRNPADPDTTWSGRGKKPLWVETWISSGRRLEDLAATVQAESPKKKGKK